MRFRQSRNPEIVIRHDTGAILADEDTGRRIHTFVTNLHQLNSLTFRKTLTAAAGLPLLLLMFTGLVMWAKPRLRRVRLAAGGSPVASPDDDHMTRARPV